MFITVKRKLIILLAVTIAVVAVGVCSIPIGKAYVASKSNGITLWKFWKLKFFRIVPVSVVFHQDIRISPVLLYLNPKL